MRDLHSLKDVISFTGVLTTAGQHFGQPIRRPTLKTVGDFVPTIPPDARRKLKSLISALQNLPSFDLRAGIAGHSSGFAPFQPDITVGPSSGAIIETVINYLKDGVVLLPATQTLVNGTDISSGNIIVPTFDEPGHYEAVIARTGITSDGITTLARRFPFTVGIPAQPPPAAPPPSSSPTCSAEFVLDGTISSDETSVRVFGRGFTATEPVQIIEGGEVRGQVAADALGFYSITIGFLRGLEPTHHVVIAHGVQSSLNSNPAGFDV